MRGVTSWPSSGRAPLVAVVHLPPSPGCDGWPGPGPAIAALRADLATLDRMDAILLENDNDKPHTLTVSKAQLAWLTRLALEARARWPDRPLGIGVQRIDWEAALAIAATAELEFVRLDVFVDRVRMQGEMVEIEPERVRALRSALDADRVALLTDVHVKHAELEGGSSIAESARRAVDAGSDAVLVTGTRTGEPPRAADLAAARAGRPVLIGSGLTPENAATLAPLADGALVGTALKDGPRVSAARVAEMVDAWQHASQR